MLFSPIFETNKNKHIVPVTEPSHDIKNPFTIPNSAALAVTMATKGNIGIKLSINELKKPTHIESNK